MTEDVGSTPRKPLTPRERLALFEFYHGKCGLCGLKINAGEPFRDEHLRSLGLGGTNKWDNRRPVHIACAEAKDPVDMRAINKAKAQKRASLGIKDEDRPKIQSRASAPTEKKTKPPLATAPGMPGLARRYR